MTTQKGQKAKVEGKSARDIWASGPGESAAGATYLSLRICV